MNRFYISPKHMTIILLMILGAFCHSLMAASPCSGSSGDIPQNNILTFKNTGGASATITNIFIGGSITLSAGATSTLNCSGGSPIEFTYTGTAVQVSSLANGGTLYNGTVSGGSITIPPEVLEENYWGTETTQKTYASNCNTAFTYKLGAGAYQDIVIPANTYCDFTFTNTAGSITNGISGYKASFVGTPGTGNSGITSFQFNTMAGWYSGSTATTIRVLAKRTNGTWDCNRFATFTIKTSQITAPTLNIKTPNVASVCAGTNVSATITAGSGGTGASDTYEYRTNGTGAWSAYTNGNNISTTGLTQVEIRVSRSAGSGTGCSATGPTVIATWTVDPVPTATPNSQVFTCDNTASLNATSVTSGATVSWQYVSGPVSPTGTTTSNPFLLTFSSAGTGIYSLLVSKGACNNINVGNISSVMPTTSSTTIASTASCGYCVVTNGNTRSFYNSSGQIIGTIQDDPSVTPAQLNLTEMCTRINNGGVQTVTDNLGNLQPYLQRQWTITPANNTKAKLTLYFTNAELTNLQAAAFSTIYQFSGYDLNVTKYPGGSGGSFTAPASASGVNVPATFSAYGVNHKVEMEVSSYSTFYVHPVLFPNAALPVELTSFTGWNQGAINKIQWITASEQNTTKYEIQKSITSGIWDIIGEKIAAGNSTQLLTYDFTDNNPVVGDNYYRLKIIDNDSTYSFSNLINIPITEVVVNNFISVSPNPTGGKLNVEIQSIIDYTTKVFAYDVLGKKIIEKESSLVKGLNTLQFDFSQLAKGTYILQYFDKDGKLHSTKFVKE